MAVTYYCSRSYGAHCKAPFRNMSQRHGQNFELIVNHGDDRKKEEKKAMNIYVGNLAYEVNDESLKTAFQVHGTVESAKVIMDRYTGRSKGFGFVEMSNRDEAVAAIEALNNTELNGRKIVVNESRPKTQRDDRRGRGGFGDGSRRYGGFGGGNRES